MRNHWPFFACCSERWSFYLFRLGCFLFIAWGLRTLALADWPEHRGDTFRSGYREQIVECNYWKPAWRTSQLNPPSPAWPAPARGSLWQRLDSLSPRVTYDRGNCPIIAVDTRGVARALVNSSGDDRLVAFNLLTGTVDWQVNTKAPVRFAPATRDGIAFFGADDGIVRAVDLQTGRLKWSQSLGPDLPFIVGNKRLISPHPVRTSVLVSDELVIAHSGLFPSQGVYAVALRAEDGALVWRRNIDSSPQGYLLETGDGRVVVPCGRSTPFAMDKSNGSFLGNLPSPGGSFCMVAPEAFFSGPGNDNSVRVYPSNQDTKLLPFAAQAVAVGDGRLWAADGQTLRCFDLGLLLEPSENALLWSTPSAAQGHLIVSGTPSASPKPQPEEAGHHQSVFVTEDSSVAVYDAHTGQLRCKLNTGDDEASFQFLAVSAATDSAPEALVATTAAGDVYCWHGTENPTTDRFSLKTVDQAKQKDLKLEDTERPQSGELEPPGEMTRPTRELGQQVESLVAHLASDAGLALIINDVHAEWTQALLQSSRLNVAIVLEDASVASRLREHFRSTGSYGQRVTTWQVDRSASLPFASGLFNLVSLVGDDSSWSQPELMRLVAPGGVLSTVENHSVIRQPISKRAGSWRHQYGQPSNSADSGDQLVGNAEAFRLHWFGGIGPRRIPDRHLRGPAPLAAGDSLVIHGDGVLIGVDPANGTERWERSLPERAMRYVMPYDGGYSALTADGSSLFLAADQEIWRLNAHTGELEKKISLPEFAQGLQWGYVSEVSGGLLASCMQPAAARFRLEPASARASYADQDYTSLRPLVSSRMLCRFDSEGSLDWQYQSQGVIPHGSIAVDEEIGRVVWLEGLNAKCRNHETGRVPLPEIMDNARLVCVDLQSGKLQWERKLDWPVAENVFYAQALGGVIVLVTSRSVEGSAEYHLRVLSQSDGRLEWEASHRHVRAGLYHGEQVHHPVALRQQDGSIFLVVEPYIYELKTGGRIVPDGFPEDWALQRPGHSCGTLSGAGNCLFFRASNPTVLKLGKSFHGERFTKLAPTRPSCWINMLPATGKLLIPEGSASCVCNYPLQTSMAFLPVVQEADRAAVPFLPNHLPASAAREDSAPDG